MRAVEGHRDNQAEQNAAPRFELHRGQAEGEGEAEIVRLVAALRVVDRELERGPEEGREALLDADSLESPLTVRTWLPGDRYLPLGAPGTRKLQDLFTDRKVPATRRGRLPVILAGRNRIAWCPGLPPAECCRITPRTGTVLRLTFEVRKPLL